MTCEAKFLFGDPPMVTSEKDPSLDVGRRFIAALGRQSWDDLAGCLDPKVQFRAVTPKGFRTADDRAAAAGYLRKWFGDADQLALQSSDVELMHDRVRIAYRIREHRTNGTLLNNKPTAPSTTARSWPWTSCAQVSAQKSLKDHPERTQPPGKPSHLPRRTPRAPNNSKEAPPLRSGDLRPISASQVSVSARYLPWLAGRLISRPLGSLDCAFLRHVISLTNLTR